MHQKCLKNCLINISWFVVELDGTLSPNVFPHVYIIIFRCSKPPTFTKIKGSKSCHLHLCTCTFTFTMRSFKNIHNTLCFLCLSLFRRLCTRTNWIFISVKFNEINFFSSHRRCLLSAFNWTDFVNFLGCLNILLFYIVEEKKVIVTFKIFKYSFLIWSLFCAFLHISSYSFLFSLSFVPYTNVSLEIFSFRLKGFRPNSTYISCICVCVCMLSLFFVFFNRCVY